jgi:SHS2 domain-containing protein
MVQTPVAGYVEIEHTADRAARVWADTLGHLFEQAGQAMFALMAPVDTISPRHRQHVTLAISDPETMLVDWLNELLFWRETRHELYSEFRVEIQDDVIQAWFAGAPAEPTLAVIKAATFHDLRVARDEQGVWQATIVFDT